MNQWEVVGVIVVLVGFVASIVAPIVKLTNTIASLTSVVDALRETVKQNRTDNKESHDKLWTKNYEQDDTLNDHETRITVLERKS